jgi:hypothetical protein
MSNSDTFASREDVLTSAAEELTRVREAIEDLSPSDQCRPLVAFLACGKSPRRRRGKRLFQICAVRGSGRRFRAVDRARTANGSRRKFEVDT